MEKLCDHSDDGLVAIPQPTDVNAGSLFGNLDELMYTSKTSALDVEGAPGTSDEPRVT